MLNRILNRISASELLSWLVFLPPADNSLVDAFRAFMQKLYRLGGKLLGNILL